MPLATLDRSTPSFFKQGPSALSKLIFFSALSLFLMVADVRFHITESTRSVMLTALFPVQWLVQQPARALQIGSEYVSGLDQANSNSADASRKLALQSLRAGQVEQLLLENDRLRKLLNLREHLATSVMAAEVLYDAADPYTRKFIIDKGSLKGVDLGSPVLDETGVLGQVTRVYPLVSEVTLVIDRDLAIPVLNVRTGARSVAFGDATTAGGGLELRFMGSNSDVQVGDLLTSSGVDGVYPAGLPVAKISRIERRAESAFAKIYCTPQALVSGARHVMVVKPIGEQIPPRPDTVAATPAGKGVAK
ncbi:Cell shape-determining protein MreC [Polaromonas vacuolata]|uniref:Cell shape-determining protein MreC n=1 Tax=Polaromonas vacuolata TaxID=37448 RepID=A0A6H2H4S0_9BURK|nr:rod shape-determining protein MreC [Polaromonas vacuolata]QJC54872.1 Cell shape-determining protein MreC [Polaromonas vacuolata]